MAVTQNLGWSLNFILLHTSYVLRGVNFKPRNVFSVFNYFNYRSC